MIREGTNFMKTGFDNQQYQTMQSEHIRKRIGQFGDKLYLEFGGKLFDDYHASRVLPGFAPDSKLQMLMQLSDQAEIVVAINAADIEKNKIRYDLGITYDVDVLRLIQSFRDRGLYVGSVVITQYTGQPAADTFKEKLERMGIRVYRHYRIEGYLFIPALSREPPRHQSRLRQVRDLPHLESAPETPGKPGLRGSHR